MSSRPDTPQKPRSSEGRSRVLALTAVIGFWLPLAGWILLGRERFSGILQFLFGDWVDFRAFRYFVVDALVICHTLLTVLALLAIRRRRFDIVPLFYAGPVLALLFAALPERADDPDWGTMGAVCFIGEVVGTFVTVIVWALTRAQPTDGQSPPSDTATLPLPKSEIQNPK